MKELFMSVLYAEIIQVVGCILLRGVILLLIFSKIMQ